MFFIDGLIFELKYLGILPNRGNHALPNMAFDWSPLVYLDHAYPAQNRRHEPVGSECNTLAGFRHFWWFSLVILSLALYDSYPWRTV